MVIEINLNRIIYNYQTKVGFENMSFYLEPNANFLTDITLSQKVPKIQEEYLSIREDLAKNLGFLININSLEQKINPKEMSEEISLFRPLLEGRSVVKRPCSINKTEEKLSLGYTISNDSEIFLLTYNSNFSQESILELYNYLFSIYQVRMSEKAQKVKNQIDFIVSQNGKPLSLEKLGLFD